MRRHVAVLAVLLAWPASCSAPTPAVPPVRESAQSIVDLQTSWMLETLARLHTQDEMRVCLGDGLPESELRHVGFDQVTLAECIDQVVQAALVDRASEGAPQTRRALTDSLQGYFAAMHEARVRRSAGAAPCLPYMR